MRVLVTGGAGFIGSNLIHALIASGYEAGIIDDLSTGNAANIHPAAWFRHLDVLDDALAGVVAAFVGIDQLAFAEATDLVVDDVQYAHRMSRPIVMRAFFRSDFLPCVTHSVSYTHLTLPTIYSV